MKYRILIVEDEAAIVGFISHRLDLDCYEVDIAVDGLSALQYIQRHYYDLVTLDIMLPHIDGFELIHSIRERSKTTLVMIVSALDTEDFKTKGYGYGADDYIAKPFSPKELALKIEASLKRREELTRQVRGKHPYLIDDSDLKQLTLHGNILSLTPSEYLILSTLVSTPTKLFSRAELSQLIYDNNLGMIDEQSIDSHIYHIRKKLRVYHSDELVQTVRGMGYTLA